MELEELKQQSRQKNDDFTGLDAFYDDIWTYPPEKNNNKWSVSWSDLMMTMFIFFAVMYAFQSSDRDLFFGDGPGRNFVSEQGAGKVLDTGADSIPARVFDKTSQAISEVMVDDPGAVDLIEDGSVRIVLSGDLLFDSGQIDLKTGARFQLDQIARALNENEFAVNVVGHADDAQTRSEKYPTNWELSSLRAVTVARYLTEVAGVDEKRVFISAHSFHQPVVSNETASDRAINRRVEIILIKEKPYGASQ